MPTAQRAPAAILVRRGGERLLFDCAEGTQRQLQRSTVGLPDIEEIFLTHFHGDHFLGLPGMLKTFALRGREEVPLTVYGPRGLKDLFSKLRPFIGRLPYRLTTMELAAGETLERGEYTIETFALDHGVAAIGYALVEHDRPGRFDVAAADALGIASGPERGILQAGEAVTLHDGRVITPDAVLGPARAGRKVVLAGDAAPPDRRPERPSRRRPRARGDLRLRRAGRARETLRSTAVDAAEVAKLAGAPARPHAPLDPLRRPRPRRGGARGVSETVVPRDFDVIEVTFPERGAPQLVKAGARPVSSAGDGADGAGVGSG